MSALCWLNGEWLPEREASIPIDDPSFLRGEGLFETIAVREGCALFVERHWARLERSAGWMNLALPISEKTFLLICRKIPWLNKRKNGRLRVTISEKTALATLASWTFAPAQPLELFLSHHRIHSRWPIAEIKSTSYAGWSCLSRRTAADTLILNEREEICETSRANVFCIFNDGIATPARASGLLPGIARSLLAGALPAEERSILASELPRCQAMFLTNALRGVMPVSALYLENNEALELDAFYPAIQQAKDTWECLVQDEIKRFKYLR